MTAKTSPLLVFTTPTALGNLYPGNSCALPLLYSLAHCNWDFISWHWLVVDFLQTVLLDRVGAGAVGELSAKGAGGEGKVVGEGAEVVGR